MGAIAPNKNPYKSGVYIADWKSRDGPTRPYCTACELYEIGFWPYIKF